MALVALGRRHDIALGDDRAAIGHEIVGARRLGIGAVGLLNRDAVREARLKAEIERFAIRIGARRRAGGAPYIGGKGIGVAAVSLVSQGSESVAGGPPAPAALHRPAVG